MADFEALMRVLVLTHYHASLHCCQTIFVVLKVPQTFRLVIERSLDRGFGKWLVAVFDCSRVKLFRCQYTSTGCPVLDTYTRGCKHSIDQEF